MVEQLLAESSRSKPILQQLTQQQRYLARLTEARQLGQSESLESSEEQLAQLKEEVLRIQAALNELRSNNETGDEDED